MRVFRLFSWPLVVGILLMFGLFVIEIFTHVLGNVAYVAIAGYALWLTEDRGQIKLITIIATILLIMGYVFAVSLQNPDDQVTFFVNRLSALIVLWFAQYFTLRYRSTQAKEHSQRIELEERMLAEERLKSSLEIYQAIARNFPIGWIGILDETLAYVVADGKGLGNSGIKAADVIGKKFSGVLKDDKSDTYLKEALGGKNVGFEISFSNRIFEINASPLRGRSQARWILVVVHDITTLKETEAGLIKALEKERELGEMKSRFVTMASHEFRTPLTTIMSSASLLSNYSGDKYEKDKATHIVRIKQSVKLLTDILNDFLSLGKLEEGNLQPNYELINLRDFLAEVAKETEPLKHGNQQLVVKHSGEVKMVSDRYFLKAILYNLLSNAFKYSNNGGQVTLEAEAENGLVNLRVTDHGIGILLEDQEHVFDRFFRGKNVVNIQGTGLGLCIAKKHVTLLQGNISFTSKVADSTTFTVQVPSMGS